MQLWVWVVIAVPWIILVVVIASVLTCYFNYVMKGYNNTCASFGYLFTLMILCTYAAKSTVLR